MGYCNLHEEQDIRLRVAWVKMHTRANEKAQMTHQNKQIAVTNGKTDELAGGGALLDGLTLRSKWRRVRIRSGSFHCGVEDLLDTEEVAEGMKRT